jgi:hypothetical protein
LDADCAYGIQFVAGSSAVTAGMYAPVKVSTSTFSTYDGSSVDDFVGPCKDSNNLFDYITVTAAPNTFDIEGALVEDVEDDDGECVDPCNSEMTHPGNTVAVEWTLSGFDFAATDNVWAPYDIIIAFDDIDDSADTDYEFDNW